MQVFATFFMNILESGHEVGEVGEIAEEICSYFALLQMSDLEFES